MTVLSITLVAVKTPAQAKTKRKVNERSLKLGKKVSRQCRHLFSDFEVRLTWKPPPLPPPSRAFNYCRVIMRDIFLDQVFFEVYWFLLEITF